MSALDNTKWGQQISEISPPSSQGTEVSRHPPRACPEKMMAEDPMFPTSNRHKLGYTVVHLYFQTNPDGTPQNGNLAAGKAISGRHL